MSTYTRRLLSIFSGESISIRYTLFLTRGLTLLAKFLFIVFLAKKLSAVEVGLYGFASAVIFIMVFVSGFEYGKHLSREVVSCNSDFCRQRVVISLTLLGFLLFSVLYPGFHYIVSNEGLSQYIPIVYLAIIAYGESYLAEHKKVLVSLQFPVYAGIVDFVKGGLWPYIVILCTSLGWLNLDLASVFLAWATFTVFGCLMVFYKLRKYYKVQNISSVALSSLKSCKEQILLSLPFFLSGLALLIIEVSGRLSLQMSGFYAETGVYTLYSGLIFSIPLFVWSTSIAPDHAGILRSYKEEGVHESDRLVIKMLKRSLLICAALVLVLYVSFDTLFNFIGKQQYFDYIGEFYLFLVVPFFHILDSHLYYMLYTRGKDRLIAFSSLLGLFSLMAFQFFTIGELALTSVVVSIVIALLISTITKLFFIGLTHRHN